MEGVFEAPPLTAADEVDNLEAIPWSSNRFLPFLFRKNIQVALDRHAVSADPKMVKQSRNAEPRRNTLQLTINGDLNYCGVHSLRLSFSSAAHCDCAFFTEPTFAFRR
jgi:hypothetical protein